MFNIRLVMDFDMFALGWTNFESTQNTLRRIGLEKCPFQLDDLIDLHPKILSWLE